MKQLPTLHTVASIKLHETLIKTPNGNWILRRPLSLSIIGLSHRLKLAIGVFTGKYDALDWTE